VAGRYVPWSLSHGAVLASVALLLASKFSRVYIPSSLSYDSMFPYGSHPDLDYRWSTELVEVIHDGYELNRFEKTEFVARSSLALRNLRVCNNVNDSHYNCGYCEKCLRTMVALEILGVIPRMAPFPPLSLSTLASLHVGTGSIRSLWLQNLAAAKSHHAAQRLIEVLELVIGRAPFANHSGTHWAETQTDGELTSR
jgi:hypothetical protein